MKITLSIAPFLLVMSVITPATSASRHHKNLRQEEPEWFRRMQAQEDATTRRRLKKSCSHKGRGKQPKDGSKCRGGGGRTIEETPVCLFGTQECERVGAHPQVSCVCDGKKWKCEETACPSDGDGKKGCPVVKPDSCTVAQECVFVTDGVTDVVEGGICTTTETAFCVDGVFNTTDMMITCVSVDPPFFDECPAVKPDACVGSQQCVFVTEGITDLEPEGICAITETANCVGGVYNTTEMLITCVSANPPSIGGDEGTGELEDEQGCPNVKPDSCTGSQECIFVTEGVTDLIEGGICTTYDTASCVDGVYNTTDFSFGCVDDSPLFFEDCPAVKPETCNGSQSCVFVVEDVTDVVPGGICTTTETANCVDGAYNTTEMLIECVDDNPPFVDNGTSVPP